MKIKEFMSDDSFTPIVTVNGALGSVNKAHLEDAPQKTDGRGNIAVIRNTMLTLVRQDGRDLTARQLTALLSVYLKDETQTVTSLAQMLNVSRPGVTRILDRLVEADLVSRAEDKADRRRVLIRRTREGMRYVQTLADVASRASDELQ